MQQPKQRHPGPRHSISFCLIIQKCVSDASCSAQFPAQGSFQPYWDVLHPLVPPTPWKHISASVHLLTHEKSFFSHFTLYVPSPGCILRRIARFIQLALLSPKKLLAQTCQSNTNSWVQSSGREGLTRICGCPGLCAGGYQLRWWSLVEFYLYSDAEQMVLTAADTRYRSEISTRENQN